MTLLRRTLFRFPKTLLVLAAAVVLYNVAWYTPKLPLPAGVHRTNIRVTLAGEEVGASVYAPRDLKAAAPVVIVAHGFSRSRRYMVGWGIALAESGMVAVVLNQPAFSDWARNGRAITELAKMLTADGDALAGVNTNGGVALLGFSMGGLSTLLAAEASPDVKGWVGLDPVDFIGRGVRAVQKLEMPCCVIRAEPGPWNRDGNAREFVEAAKAPLFALKVRGRPIAMSRNRRTWLAGSPAVGPIRSGTACSRRMPSRFCGQCCLKTRRPCARWPMPGRTIRSRRWCADSRRRAGLRQRRSGFRGILTNAATGPPCCALHLRGASLSSSSGHVR